MSTDGELVEITRKMLSDFEEFIDCYIVCAIGIDILDELQNNSQKH